MGNIAPYRIGRYASSIAANILVASLLGRNHVQSYYFIYVVQTPMWPQSLRLCTNIRFLFAINRLLVCILHKCFSQKDSQTFCHFVLRQWRMVNSKQNVTRRIVQSWPIGCCGALIFSFFCGTASIFRWNVRKKSLLKTNSHL